MITGQWVGNYNGTSDGLCVINIEPKDGILHCYSYLLERNAMLPSSYAYFVLDEGRKEYELELLNIGIIDRNYNLVPQQFKDKVLSESFPQASFPEKAKIKINVVNGEMLIKIITSIETELDCRLYKEYEKDYSLKAEQVTWQQFKDYLEKINYRQVAFRGQADTWPLRTSFHRSNRFDVQVFASNDIPMLNRHLSSLTTHYFNLLDTQHAGAFLNLIQHHGYPTPLLDWSFSPYVAAFFAFSKIEKKELEEDDGSRRVRIFTLDIERWKADFQQFYNIYDCRLHVSIGEYMTLDNKRATPQQALTTLTNIYDIEGYFYMRAGGEQKYLNAFDISIKEHTQVMRDLTLMGVTYGSLFPGLDGACYDLRKINFPDS
ncbi:FRG domain-containing protein [Pantoea ananatis]|uniref:FRG domain-containing protein n=1 Tax=Pantoea ananas TaxID=553 RepID=UPI001B302598|nr:FRG domain-containing protein [Pantoea ananatis]